MPTDAQFKQLKALHGPSLLLFRIGDFYELFRDDAETASRLLGLTLTHRGKKSEPRGTPMCGFPYYHLDGYIARLVSKGHMVAVCEQLPA